jgi:hypothetical protein
MNTVVYVPTTYRYRTEAEAAAEPAALEQTSATRAEAQPEPADLDAALTELDDCLQKLDNLAGKEREFPSTIANIDGKLKELEAQDLDTLQALESRSAQVSKLSNMRLLAASQAKKVTVAIAAQREAVIKIGTRAACLLEQRWWANYSRLADEARGEFHRLFHHPFELEDLLASYKPLVLLGWLKAPDFRTGALDTKLVRCRQLRQSADRLREFERMTFQEVSDELEAQDRESRERAQQVRKIGSEPVLREPGN